MKAKEAAKALAGLIAKDADPSKAVVAAASAALGSIGEGFDPDVLLNHADWDDLYIVKGTITAWEKTAKPGDERVIAALREYIHKKTDNRYKGRAKDLIRKLGGTPGEGEDDNVWRLDGHPVEDASPSP